MNTTVSPIPPGPVHIATLASLQGRVGQHLATSDWVTIDQARIDQFAQATGDHQWIHVDPVRAAAGPFGTTIAHGFLTLSLLPLLAGETLLIDDVRMGVNYGLNKVRFPAPVPVGSRLRAQVQLLAYEPIAGGAQLTMAVTIEREGSDKPVCVAEAVSRRYT
ncbi:MaoC family dehydratase [Aquabacterium sp. OR-4]|uniref:MaoC family dehydratase n=1 Tax=Aquabacterium sp. OR-4 TaxID=2978127 RepID=UPI0021B19105|nr:MaoC family dehydratase [Aquabacterium sp. OR-4]MDT7835804.1 MaoC family dehydratase [Aquabacterium sp. OR-4]